MEILKSPGMQHSYANNVPIGVGMLESYGFVEIALGHRHGIPVFRVEMTAEGLQEWPDNVRMFSRPVSEVV